MAYNPSNNRLYAAGQPPSKEDTDLATSYLEIDPRTWTVCRRINIPDNRKSFFCCATFDPFTGYMVFGRQGYGNTVQFATSGLLTMDPGTGREPKSLNRYPIPHLPGYAVDSVAIRLYRD